MSPLGIRARRFAVAAATVLAGTGAISAPTTARAQASSAESIAAAQTLYEAAVDLMGKKQFDAACPKLEEAARLVPEGVGVRLQLGECFEGQGKLASAWTTYALAEQLAARAGQRDREALAADRAAKLKPRLATMTVTVPPAIRTLPGLHVSRAGVEIGPAQWEIPLPVDRGEHAIDVRADGKVPFSKKVVVKRDGEKVQVGIGPLLDDPNAGEARPGTDWKLPTGLVLGGFGIAAIGVGAALGGVALDKTNEVETRRLCDDALVCDAEGIEIRSEARTLANVATGLFVGGGVVLGTGTLFLILSATGSDDDAKESPSAAIQLGVDRVGIVGHW